MKPQPTMTLTDFREQSRKIQVARAEARRDFLRYSEQECDAERDYRRELAIAFAKAKVEGSVAEAELRAAESASDAKHRRDLAHSLAKSSLLRVEALEADRATLRSIATWSQAIDSVGVGGVAS